MTEIKDSGSRREFYTGAVRDIAEGKGRCDLLPLRAVAELIGSPTLIHIDVYMYTGCQIELYAAINTFTEEHRMWEDTITAILEVAKQYENGIVKYGERNWEKGIPLHCFIDSGVRHYLKYRRGDDDEPHDKAFIWNILGALWTQQNKPGLIDLPFGILTKEGESGCQRK